MALLIGGVMWAAWDRSNAPPAPPAPHVGVHAGTLSPALPAAAAASRPWSDDNPTSLDHVARMFDIGMAGDLRLDMDTLSALELTLAQLGDSPNQEQIARAEASLRKELPPAAAREAIALVHSYRAYKAAYAREFGQGKPLLSLADVQAQLVQQEALQRRHFDADTATALFGAQMAHTRYLLEVQAIEGDAGLSNADKRQRIATLRQRLPQEVADLDAPAPPPAEAELQRTVEALRERGASEEEVQRARLQVLGAEAAADVAEQERQRDQFEGRLRAYLKERSALPAPTAEQHEELLRRHFSAEEVAAVRAQERNLTR